MYIHLGQDTVIDSADIIGIFDLDTATVSKRTRDYLAKSQKNGQVVTVSFELPKAFVVCSEPGTLENKVYISQISSSTLYKRIEYSENIMLKIGENHE